MKRQKKKKAPVTQREFSKRMVTWILAVCLVDLQLHYVLAYTGRDPLISLAERIIDVILGTVLIYSLKAFFGKWKEEKTRLEEKEMDYVHNASDDADSSEDRG